VPRRSVRPDQAKVADFGAHTAPNSAHLIKRDGLWSLYAPKASHLIAAAAEPSPQCPPLTFAGNAADAYASAASTRARATNRGTPSPISANHGSVSLPARYRA
jgi:hypothetical protein